MPHRRGKSSAAVAEKRKTQRRSIRRNVNRGVGAVATSGSRAQVMHGTAMKTPGGLSKGELMYNKSGRIVSVRKHKLGGMRWKRLVASGKVHTLTRADRMKGVAAMKRRKGSA